MTFVLIFHRRRTEEVKIHTKEPTIRVAKLKKSQLNSLALNRRRLWLDQSQTIV